MRAPRFIGLIVIITILGVLAVAVANQVSASGVDNIPDYTSSPQAHVLPENITAIGQPVENVSVPDNGFTEPVTVSQEILDTNDPYLKEQWGLTQIEAQRFWQVTTGSPEIVVAILDTGIDASHQDLDGKVVMEANFTDSHTPGDIYGHGTHIAGIIAAHSNNGIGITGLAPASLLMNVKVANDSGRCQASALAAGIIWAVDNGANVVNISIEVRESLPALEEATNYAWSRGAIVIAAAGNDGNALPVYPGCYDSCIAVASTQQDDTLAPLSNYGDWVDVAAPGFYIYSTLPNNNYGYKTGTSFASAYVSGLAALLFSVATDTNGDGRLNDEVLAAIKAGCEKMGINGVTAGRIDAANSLAEMSP